ncbi:hypothetical protein BJ912DRAFT_443839 [Pholiota molesta]|nr:hypothetical protein BJ912DRAFT_443839 [Pholiota molesta]
MSTSSSQSPAPEFDLTIKGELDKIKGYKEKFPAANLLYAILRYLSVNVNSAERNIHTSAQVLIRANKLYEAIIQSMDTLDKSSLDDLEKNWALFDNYTTVIPLLERILLNVASNTEKRSHTPPATTTQEAVQHIATWLADRNALKEALESLKANALHQNVPDESVKLIAADHIVHRKKDDDSTLRVLHAFIAKSKLLDTHIIQRRGPWVTEVKALVKELIEKLAQKPGSEDVSGVVVRTVMTAYIPFSVLASSTTTAPWQAYLRTNEIWVTLKDLLTKVKGFTEKPAAVATLDADFDKMEKLLLKLTDTVVETADEMLQLIKLAARIHRPYSGRTAALVKTVYSVDQASRKNTALTVPRHNLKLYMQTALDYLTTIKTSAYDFSTFSLDSPEYKDRKGEHEKLFKETSPLYTSCNVPTADWNNQNVAYTAAVSVDETNVKDAQGKLFPAAGGNS